ncbi:3025_t:CDS:2 [Diversispora eburnea]|uniref:3025_t:CDS:1 n=1 Tax=Diversispora eburnea TaxID=1213867 RepID=A0A9N8YNV5_9GLOM|nr:3025_t:CDS:2 [Diversispora eburnea]
MTNPQDLKNVITENVNDAPHERINNNYNLSNLSNELEHINLNNDNNDDVFNYNDVFNDDDDDSDLSELEPFGYELLNQEDDRNEDEGEDEDNEDEYDLQNSEILNLKNEIPNEIPNKLQISPSNEEKISDGDLNLINSIMKNVRIPDSSIPG